MGYFSFPFPSKALYPWVTINNDGHVVTYKLKVENGKGTLHLQRILNVDVLGLEAKYYPALRNFFHSVKIGDEQQIVLQPGSAAAKN